MHILGAGERPIPAPAEFRCAHSRAAFALGVRMGRAPGFRLFLQHAYRFWAESRNARDARRTRAAEQLNAWLKAAAAAWAAAPLGAGTEDRAEVNCAAFERLWNSAAAHALRLDCGCEEECVRACRAGLQAAACSTTAAEHAAPEKATRSREL